MQKRKETLPGQIHLIFFGDSICHGQRVSVDRVFVTHLAAHLNSRFEAGVLVENRSINGNTTRQALERLAYDVTSHAPDLVYVQFGLNDCNVWATDFDEPRVGLDAYAGNLREIIAKLRAAGVSRVMLATNHACLLGEAYEQRLLAYNDAVRRVSRETFATLVDVRAAVPGFDPSAMLMADGIHLAEAGHRFYFELLKDRMAAEVEKLLASAAGEEVAQAVR